MEWLDKPEQTELSIEIDGEKVMLHIGNCAIGLFRKRPEMDYLAYKGDEENWTLCFDRHALIYWMGGIALESDAMRQMQNMNRTNGIFSLRYGWRPETIVEDYPNDWETALYLEYRTGDDDLHDDLERNLEEDE